MKFFHAFLHDPNQFSCKTRGPIRPMFADDHRHRS